MFDFQIIRLDLQVFFIGPPCVFPAAQNMSEISEENPFVGIAGVSFGRALLAQECGLNFALGSEFRCDLR